MKTPTAREFYDVHDSDDAVVMMIDFAKMHVEAALEAACNKAVEIQKPTSRKYVSKKELKASYPLENIK